MQRNKEINGQRDRERLVCLRWVSRLNKRVRKGGTVRAAGRGVHTGDNITKSNSAMDYFT